MFFGLVLVFAFLCVGVLTATVPYSPHVPRSGSGTRAQIIQGNVGTPAYIATLSAFPGKPEGEVVAEAPANGTGVNFDVMFIGLPAGQPVSMSTFSFKLGTGAEV